MRFYPPENRTGYGTTGYPFLPDGNEDKKRIDAEQLEMLREQGLAPQPAHDLTKRRRTRHHTVEQEGVG